MGFVVMWDIDDSDWIVGQLGMIGIVKGIVIDFDIQLGM